MSNGNDGRLGRMVEHLGGAFGAGLVLIVLPSAALVLGMPFIASSPIVGLPILAIFGIMILFGALSLVSTLFARLNLADATQALALPDGSVRAAIALALIVLFAIMAIMLYQTTAAQTLATPYVIGNLTEAQKTEVLNDRANHVIAVVRRCASATDPCPPAELLYEVHVRQPQAQEATDLAKQLLILIGTLMTSVTSFYFGFRSSEPKSPSVANPSPSGAATAASPVADELIDGCEVAITDATPDEALPASTGGVA